MTVLMSERVIEAGDLRFGVDARLLRELGERLVRRPETALIELIKNSYDADARECRIERHPEAIVVADDGTGMTLSEFSGAWMTIGTASKAGRSRSKLYGRAITGEKGIGRFSVRFLGEKLLLESVSQDDDRGVRTLLRAAFDWPTFDASQDIGTIEVPYQLIAVSDDTPAGTRLEIRGLRPAAQEINENQVRTASIGLVSPLRTLMSTADARVPGDDPGFRLVFGGTPHGDEDVSEPILSAYALRAALKIAGGRLELQVFEKDSAAPELRVVDSVPGRFGELVADVRFFPRRSGSFRGLGVDGRIAHTWIRENSGVAVFDRDFRVSPYGEQGDDWLSLTADAAQNVRKPRSGLAKKHFPMSETEQASTSENWMLRLPLSSQLVGVVQVAGARSAPGAPEDGLVAAADREGFIANAAYEELRDHVRGAVEALAYVDRRLQKRLEEAERQARLQSLQAEAAAAAEAVQQNPDLSGSDKKRIVAAITSIATDATAYEEATREKVRQLETMSLLGVVAGYMTHEFGVALAELDAAHNVLQEWIDSHPDVAVDLERFAQARSRLTEFIDYSTAYIRGGRRTPDKPYAVLPRINHVRNTFGAYAEERGVTVEVDIDKGLMAPLVPTSLYDGVLLNLFTNALKAVTGASGSTDGRLVRFHAWNERSTHFLEVSDTGVGVPEVLRERVFDPLFTTTDSRHDPLGSGMGLGLALVRASAEAFGGRVRIVDPPPGFATCVSAQFPL